MSEGAAPASSGSLNRRFVFALISQAVAWGGLFLTVKYAMKFLDPYKEQREEARRRALEIQRQLGCALNLNEYEQLLASNVMRSDHIDVSLDDIKGLDTLVKELQLKVVLPMKRPDLYRTTLWRQVKGVLLYGPPGTGKTMLVKALARESGCFFLNVTASSIMSKWLGDANRLVRAVFSLAQKLQPCIIFIDEVDALLGKRGGGQEHEAMLQVKTEMMQLWDGFESMRGMRVAVMGATNRPWMIDEAVLRRFSLQYELGLPGPEQRSHILRGYLLKHAAEVIGSVDDALLCNQTVAGITAPGQGAIDWVASRTADFSGSDLQELCAQAAQRVLGEFELEAEQGASLLDAAMARSPGLFGGLRRALGAGESDAAAAAASSSHQQKPADVVQKLRPVALSDFVSVLKFVKPSTRNAAEYRSANNWEGGGGGSGLSITDLLQLATAMYNLQGGAAAGAARSGGAANGSQSTSAHNDAAPAPSAS